MDSQAGSSVPPSGAPPSQDGMVPTYQSSPYQDELPESPVYQPPAFQPPVSEPPVYPSQAYQPPVYEPPTDQPSQAQIQDERPVTHAHAQHAEEDAAAGSQDRQKPANPANLPEYLKPPVEEVVYQWTAPSRPFKQRNRRYFTTVMTIALLISLILFFAGQFLPIAVVVAIAFLAYIMATIPPHQVTNQITTYGIRLENELYFWEELGWFWFTTKYNDRLLNIEVGRFPNRLMLLVGESSEDDLRYILEAVLVENTPPPTYFEKVAAWLQEKIPLDVE